MKFNGIVSIDESNDENKNNVSSEHIQETQYYSMYFTKEELNLIVDALQGEELNTYADVEFFNKVNNYNRQATEKYRIRYLNVQYLFNEIVMMTNISPSKFTKDRNFALMNKIDERMKE